MFSGKIDNFVSPFCEHRSVNFNCLDNTLPNEHSIPVARSGVQYFIRNYSIVPRASIQRNRRIYPVRLLKKNQFKFLRL